MHTLGVLQLDFVNVLVPAHYLILWSRLGSYDRKRSQVPKSFYQLERG